MSVCSERASVKGCVRVCVWVWVWEWVCGLGGRGVLWILIVLPNPFVPASLLCIFHPFFCYFLICDSSWYLQVLLYGNETGSWFPPNTVMVGVPFASQPPKQFLCSKFSRHMYNPVLTTKCNSAVGSYRKEAGCIVTLTSWCNALWSCSQIHSFKSFKGPLKLSC